jgi:hypothetical protein
MDLVHKLSTIALALNLGLIPPPTASPFDVTDGEITGNASDYHVGTAEMRATIKDSQGSMLITTFRYRGATKSVSKLADGEVRHQFGLALRAQDICNRVYIMLHFDTDEVFVQVKRNPGETTHEQCGDNGYTTVASWRVSPIVQNQSYYLSAKITGHAIAVNTEGSTHVVALPLTAFSFDGPAGIRSDNAVLDFTYQVNQ